MIIYGKNTIREAIYAKRKIYEITLDEKFNDYKYLNFLKENDLEIKYTNKGELNNLTNNGIHQGVTAKVKPYEYKELHEVLNKDVRQRFLILDGIQDPHNFGAIIRTAEATKLDGIIVTKKNQVPLTAVVAKVSSGAIEHVNIILVTNINQTIKVLKENNVWVVGTDGSAEKNYLELPKEESLAIIVGNEGAGIRPLVKQNCDILVKIPMLGKVNSLNVSVAAALMLYASL
ncbi:MAG TPA: 23S rRNA (guanosine(2251)-2'-O)-methyltransferase RlmB [Acholeplasma sp.]|nr:23S rRNA (guanosine(2251)-2'-O)-methyltransferase RlmB [Acholeplasma sp.]